jgi:hypothetical protein
LLKDLSLRKVVMMNAVPRREKTEQTFSVISTARIWPSEKAIVECGKVHERPHINQGFKADCDAH